jgi:dUTP pyrophosphatase
MELAVLFEIGNTVDAITRRIEALEAKPVVKFKKLHAEAQIPKYQTAGAAGMDLVACNDEPITLWTGAEAMLVPTGLSIELPQGYEAQVRPRSGLSLKGVSVANSPGTVDEDYRGEIKVIMRNHGHTIVIHKGDRIAQLVIARVQQAEVVEATELSDTERGSSGFGSTGSK